MGVFFGRRILKLISISDQISKGFYIFSQIDIFVYDVECIINVDIMSVFLYRSLKFNSISEQIANGFLKFVTDR